MSESSRMNDGPLAKQTAFWRRAAEKGLHKTDVWRLRDDLKRLEELAEQMGQGGACCEDMAHEVRRIRESVAKDYGTQALILQTLIEVLIDKDVMSEDEFADKLDEIDLRDGVRDGMLHAGGQPPATNQE